MYLILSTLIAVYEKSVVYWWSFAPSNVKWADALKWCKEMWIVKMICAFFTTLCWACQCNDYCLYITITPHTSYLASVEVVSLSSSSTVSSKGRVECGPKWVTDQCPKVDLLGLADEAKKEKSYDLVRESHGCFLRRVFLCWYAMLQWKLYLPLLKIKHIYTRFFPLSQNYQYYSILEIFSIYFYTKAKKEKYCFDSCSKYEILVIF